MTPEKDDSPLNGVTTLDLLAISKHILGVEALDSPYKMISADANHSGSITTFDIVELRKLILGIYQELPNNTSWRFVYKDFVFPNPNNPFSSQFPESVQFNVAPPFEFIGMKIGDVNLTAIPNFKNQADGRTTFPIILKNQNLLPGKKHIVPIKTGGSEKIEALQFALQFDANALTINNLRPGEALPGFGENHFFQPLPGELRVSWENVSAIETSPDQAVLFLEIEAKTAATLSEVLRFSSEKLPAEAYSSDGRTFKLDLQFAENQLLVEGLKVFPVCPNPATESAFWPVQLPTENAVRLDVFDVSGKNVFSKNLDLPAGLNRLEIPVSGLAPGSFVCRVWVDGSVFFQRFIK